MLTLQLKPGVGLGPFMLGQSLLQAFQHVQGRKQEYRCVEVKYAEQDLLSYDLILNLPEHGLHLRFDSPSQRLRLIEVYDLSRMQVRCGVSLVGGASKPATVARVYDLCGPTYPGQLDADGQHYLVQYPGAMFLFAVFGAAPSKPPDQEMPAALPGGALPVADRLCIFAGSAASTAAVAGVPVPEAPPGDVGGEHVDAYLGQGLVFRQASAVVSFGDSPQDVKAQLGAPSSSAPKSATGANGGQGVPDFFYTYSDRGLDILFCGRTNRVIKFVLHSNNPGHPLFNMYCKCNFHIHRQPSPEAQQLLCSSLVSPGDARLEPAEGLSGLGKLPSILHQHESDTSHGSPAPDAEPQTSSPAADRGADGAAEAGQHHAQAEQLLSGSEPRRPPAAPQEPPGGSEGGLADGQQHDAVQQGVTSPEPASQPLQHTSPRADPSAGAEAAHAASGQAPQAAVGGPIQPVRAAGAAGAAATQLLPGQEGTWVWPASLLNFAGGEHAMDLFGLGDGSASTEQAPEQDFFGLAQAKPAGSAAGTDEAAPELHRDHGPGTPDAPEPPSMLAGSALGTSSAHGGEGWGSQSGWNDGDGWNAEGASDLGLPTPSVLSRAASQQALPASAEAPWGTSGSAASAWPPSLPASRFSSAPAAQPAAAAPVAASMPASSPPASAPSGALQREASWEVPEAADAPAGDPGSPRSLLGLQEATQEWHMGPGGPAHKPAPPPRPAEDSGDQEWEDVPEHQPSPHTHAVQRPASEAPAPQSCMEGIITANSKWGDIQAAFGAAERATLHARSLHAGPHNPSYVVGYRGVAFEVTKAGYIASATLFMA